MQTRTILCGLIAGGICTFGLRMTFLLAWPARYIPGWSTMPDWGAWLGPFFCALVIITFAWISAAWGWKETRADAARVGAATGFLATCCAFVLAGSSVAGLLGLEPLLKHGLAPIADQELIKTLIADIVVNTMRATHLILWGSMAAGVLLGALGGLLAPLTALKLGPAPKRLPGRLLVWPFVFLLLFTPLFAEVSVSMIAAFYADLRFVWQYANNPPILAFMDFPLATQLGFLAFGLGAVWPWLARWWKQGRSCFVVVLSLIAALGLVFILLQGGGKVIEVARSGYNNIGDGFTATLIIVTASLIFLIPLPAGFLLGGWLIEKPQPISAEPLPESHLFDHLVVSLWMGLAAFLPAWEIISYALNMIMGAISMLRSISGEYPYEKPLTEIINSMISIPFDYSIKVFLPFFIVLGWIFMGIFALFGGKERELPFQENHPVTENAELL